MDVRNWCTNCSTIRLLSGELIIKYFFLFNRRACQVDCFQIYITIYNLKDAKHSVFLAFSTVLTVFCLQKKGYRSHLLNESQTNKIQLIKNLS